MANSSDRSKSVLIEEKLNKVFSDDAPTGFGTGWWSGILSAFFGLLSLGAVICLHFPQLFSSPELRPHYPMHIVRILIQSLILGAFIFGAISSFLRKKKALAMAGIALALNATLLGGASVQINEKLSDGPAIGLDWFLLDLFLMAIIFVPVERLWPRYLKQGTFRKEWLIDTVYFMSTHLPLQILSFLVFMPSTIASKYLASPWLKQTIGASPWFFQFLLAVLLADLVEYCAHLALHKVPFLWRFHAIHHSSKGLDWLAGSRAHFIEDIFVRGLIAVPLMIGFSTPIITAYLIFVTLHATWAHCNFRPTVKWLEPYLVFPRHHHWHHASTKEALDKNFAIHFPWIDKIFGTFYCPDEWPETFGLDGEEIPDTFLKQTVEPFFKNHKKVS